MTGPQTEQQWRWAEALVSEKLCEADAHLRITERIGVHALIGDRDGAERVTEIAACFEQMLLERVDRGQ